MAIYWPTPDLKGRMFKLCVLTRWDFKFCVRSSPLRERGGGGCLSACVRVRAYVEQTFIFLRFQASEKQSRERRTQTKNELNKCKTTEARNYLTLHQVTFYALRFHSGATIHTHIHHTHTHTQKHNTQQVKWHNLQKRWREYRFS